MRRALPPIAALSLWPVSVFAAEPCRFDHQQLFFVGTAVEQALCLTRRVRAYGELDPAANSLPPPLDKLVGTIADISVPQLRAYLLAGGRGESTLGGSLDRPVSRAMAGDPHAPLARYFVIHDTSTPALGADAFPEDIDRASWPHNKLDSWIAGDKSHAHVFISRTGESATAVDFFEPWRATKFESQDTLLRRKGLFLHIELVMPRRYDRDGSVANEALAPEPGFPQAQYERLALVYVAASVRAGQWLIPAFHAVLDTGRVDAHDDPQNFSIELFAAALARALTDIHAGHAAAERYVPFPTGFDGQSHRTAFRSSLVNATSTNLKETI